MPLHRGNTDDDGQWIVVIFRFDRGFAVARKCVVDLNLGGPLEPDATNLPCHAAAAPSPQNCDKAEAPG